MKITISFTLPSSSILLIFSINFSTNEVGTPKLELIANFNSLDLRNDKGVLWENFLISERMKTLNYEGIWTNTYFWRTKTQQEIDYLEERDGALYAYEFKWSKQKVKFPKSFLENYQVKVSDVITKENFDLFLGVE